MQALGLDMVVTIQLLLHHDCFQPLSIAIELENHEIFLGVCMMADLNMCIHVLANVVFIC